MNEKNEQAAEMTMERLITYASLDGDAWFIIPDYMADIFLAAGAAVKITDDEPE